MANKCCFNPDVSIGVKFSILSRIFKSRIDEKFKNEGLTAVQASTIKTVSNLEEELGRSVTITDIKEAQNLSHPTMIEIIKKLENKGFVETTKSETDRRSRIVKLTPKANGFNSSIREIVDGVYDSLSSGIDKEELRQMEDTINKMIMNAIGGDN